MLEYLAWLRNVSSYIELEPLTQKLVTGSWTIQGNASSIEFRDVHTIDPKNKKRCAYPRKEKEMFSLENESKTFYKNEILEIRLWNS